MKVATIFSGGLASVEWALKYAKIKHEVIFACEIDKFANLSDTQLYKCAGNGIDIRTLKAILKQLTQPKITSLFQIA